MLADDFKQQRYSVYRMSTISSSAATLFRTQCEKFSSLSRVRFPVCRLSAYHFFFACCWNTVRATFTLSSSPDPLIAYSSLNQVLLVLYASWMKITCIVGENYMHYNVGMMFNTLNEKIISSEGVQNKISHCTLVGMIWQ